ncbi:MAG: iron ABC transporter permease [Desulfobacterales bacterium]|nr:iron ABC transporter permease [Desulfobacterales bacterium]
MTRCISFKYLLLLLSASLAAGLGLSAISGRVDMTHTEILDLAVKLSSGTGQIISSFLQGDSPELWQELTAKESVFLWIRMPRCIMAVLVGAGLAVSGAVYQALFRNPLVSPDILGVSAGCTFGAALGLMLPIDNFGTVHLLSFSFGIIAVLLSAGLAKAIAVKPVIVLVLAGMVVLSFFNALLMVIKYFADPYNQLPGIIFWVMGSLTRVTWGNTLFMAPFALAGLFTFIILSYRLNILSLGDIQARSLGLNPVLFRRLLITMSSFMVAVSVSTCGQIAWIGLIIPHMARTLAGPAHERMLPVTALLGALFLLLTDTAARSLFTSEIPVGIITALTGAPVFAFLLYKNRGTGWM